MSTSKIPVWFWIVAVLALLWNLMGVAVYISDVTKTDEALAALPEAERLLYEMAPAWATGAFALAVFAGTLGCLFLLLRKSWAVPAFVISLVGVIVQNIYWVFMTNAMDVYGPSGAIMPLMVVLIGIALLIASRRWSARSWLT